MAPTRASRLATRVFHLALSLAAAAATPSCQNTVDGVLTLGNSSAFVTYGTVFVQGCNNTVTTAAGEMVIINGNNNTVANNSYGVLNTCGESCPASFDGTCTFNVIIDGANSNVVVNNLNLECAYFSNWASSNVFKFNDAPVFTDSSSASDNVVTNNTIGTHIKLRSGASNNVIVNNVATDLTDSSSASDNTVVGNTAALSIDLYKHAMNNTIVGNAVDYLQLSDSASDNVVSFNNFTGKIHEHTHVSNNTITSNFATKIIMSDYASGNTISRNNVSGGSGGQGIHMSSGASDNTLVGNTANNYLAVYGRRRDGYSATGNNITGNTITGNISTGQGYLYVATDAHNNTVANNVADDIKMYDHVNNNTVANNKLISSAGTDGFYMYGYASDNIVMGNNVTGSDLILESTAIGNTITGNSADYIKLSDSASNNLVANNHLVQGVDLHYRVNSNVVAGNVADYVHMSHNASDNTVTGNNVSSGIYLDYALDNSVVDNSLSSEFSAFYVYESNITGNVAAKIRLHDDYFGDTIVDNNVTGGMIKDVYNYNADVSGNVLINTTATTETLYKAGGNLFQNVVATNISLSNASGWTVVGNSALGAYSKVDTQGTSAPSLVAAGAPGMSLLNGALWMLAPTSGSCNKACAPRGGCVASAFQGFPATRHDLVAVISNAGLSTSMCSSFAESQQFFPGPNFDGETCYYGTNGTCGAVGGETVQDGELRFCPPPRIVGRLHVGHS